ncbi:MULTISPECIES: HypC/HybG/HupF family hydrogenase formation chaperone [unclassified Wenzhouxiangella]|uniref:HypC/HybG/HupF family hydrogenase formation chaperone n=1 Tax=unclassified Wenzhouxiangella TaxID=2613841 RepID=UPI000E32AAF1|nr:MULTISPECIES: HypC/HybG/HupF family hydrogenase formation chaperone [unclassified Wenzhouxiangella]RFF28072.1 HypC/HybG/HupF family hydrogenase formation chaperone [Wenzhouxiangella sp. 15181]RFP68658.1 HypC/HybG/HupF family hydrogenase formation chaperone [Wenzhouxiangella sp. 15190]
MCLAVPVEVIELLEHDQALVDIGGVRSRVSLAFVDDVEVGDYVIVHVGHAITRLDVEEAERTLELFREITDHLAAENNALRQ